MLVLDGLGSQADLETVVRRALADLAEPFLDGLQPLKPVPRLGVVFCAPGQALRSAGTLLQQAENALPSSTPKAEFERFSRPGANVINKLALQRQFFCSGTI
jgi:hypothetical protein